MKTVTTVALPGWSVSVTTGTDIEGAIANVHRTDWFRGRPRYGDLNGRQYASNEAAWAALREHGYSVVYVPDRADSRQWRREHDRKFNIHYVRLPDGGLFTLPRESLGQFFREAANMPSGALVIPAGQRAPALVTA